MSMGKQSEVILIVENTNLSEDDFLNKFLDFIEKSNYYYVIPDWMALKLNKYGDSGATKGELESRIRRRSNIISIKPKQENIEILNIAGIRSFFGSFNCSVKIKNIVENGSSYSIYAKTYPVPNITLIPIIFISTFILSAIFVKNGLSVIILTFAMPFIFMKLSQIKMLKTIQSPAQKMEKLFSEFKYSLLDNKTPIQP